MTLELELKSSLSLINIQHKICHIRTYHYFFLRHVTRKQKMKFCNEGHNKNQEEKSTQQWKTCINVRCNEIVLILKSYGSREFSWLLLSVNIRRLINVHEQNWGTLSTSHLMFMEGKRNPSMCVNQKVNKEDLNPCKFVGWAAGLYCLGRHHKKRNLKTCLGFFLPLSLSSAHTLSFPFRINK